jgi:cytochrome c5
MLRIVLMQCWSRWFRIGISVSALLLALGDAAAELSGSLEESAIVLRLQPEAQLQVQADSTLTGALNPAPAAIPIANIGKHRYEETCHICHGPGLAGAPKFQDHSDWAPRIAEGVDVLVQRAIQGYKAMPPKGSCMSCSAEEIKKAVEYMISEAK